MRLTSALMPAHRPPFRAIRVNYLDVKEVLPVALHGCPRMCISEFQDRSHSQPMRSTGRITLDHLIANISHQTSGTSSSYIGRRTQENCSNMARKPLKTIHRTARHNVNKSFMEREKSNKCSLRRQFHPAIRCPGTQVLDSRLRFRV